MEPPPVEEEPDNKTKAKKANLNSTMIQQPKSKKMTASTPSKVNRSVSKPAMRKTIS